MPNLVHFEIYASQPQVLIDFYSQVFGWQVNQWGEMDYWMVDTGSEGQGGINSAIAQRPLCSSEISDRVNAFVCTVAVDDIDAVLEKALASGASLQLEKNYVPGGVGWIAYIKDPDGNLMCLLQPDEME